MAKKSALGLALLAAIGAAVLVPPAFGQGDQTRGRRLYELKCGRCHYAYEPAIHSLEGWKTVLRDMGAAAGLDDAAEADILAYLTAALSGREAAGSGLPTAPVLSGYLYSELFSAGDIVDTFDLHYLNVNLAGRLHPLVSYRAEFEFEHGGGKVEPAFVEQAYLDIRLHDALALKIGGILTPFNRFDELHGPLENRLVTRPYVSREIGVSAWKDVGVDVHGHLNLNPRFFLQYDAYMINGLGAGARLRSSRQYLDNNDGKSLGLRLTGVLDDRWEAGLSYYTGVWDAAGDYSLRLAGVHILGSVGELGLFAEYARAVSENPDPIDKGKADGWFFQVDYLFARRFRPVFRYDTLDYLDPGEALGRKPSDLMASTASLGFDYYLTPSIVFKVEYDLIKEGSRKPKVDNNLFSLQAAVRF